MQPLSVFRVVLLGSLLIVPGLAAAGPLGPPTVQAGVNCLGVAKNFDGNTGTSLFCNEDNFFGGVGTGHTYSLASAEAHYATGSPGVSVTAINTVTPPVPVLLLTTSTATVLYDIQVVYHPNGVYDDHPGGPGTSVPFEIPVSISASGSVTTEGGTAAYGQAAVSIRGSVFQTSAGFGGPASDSFVETGPIYLSTTDPTQITISASCSALADNDFEQHASCRAEADPLFFFDDAAQAAFDQLRALQGLASFALAEFYSFDFSDGVSNTLAAPEPGTVAILGLGLAGLGVVRRRRRRR